MTQLVLEKLIAYRVARDLLVSVREAEIGDSKLRDQALRAAKSACLNIAEGAGRAAEADKRRAFGIARGEAVETAAALDIAMVTEDCRSEPASRGYAHATRLCSLLTGLIRLNQRESQADPESPPEASSPDP